MNEEIINLMIDNLFTGKENISDGLHTFGELYDCRMLLNALLFNKLRTLRFPCNVYKSRRHNDGELCFGGGWFIVVWESNQGQISFHYLEKYWELFSIPEVEKVPVIFDGHTTADVIKRLAMINYMDFNTYPQDGKLLSTADIIQKYSKQPEKV